jgi:hypothetical protein
MASRLGKIKKPRLWRAFAAALLLLSPSLYAGSLDNSVIGLFPRNIEQLAYVNLSEARKLAWFSQFQQQVLPASVIAFEQFVSAAGIDPNSQINAVAWAYGSSMPRQPGPIADDGPGGEIVGVITGNFDPDSAAAAFQAKNSPAKEINGYTLYSCLTGSNCGNFYFFFMDANTAAFGQIGMLRRLIDVKRGAAESVLSNQAMYALIDQANGDATFWSASNSAGARAALKQLAPEVSQFSAATSLLGNLKSLVTTVDSSSGMEIHLQLACGSPSDSLFLSQMLQAGLLLRKYQAGQEQPALTRLLDQTTVTPHGPFLDISIEASNDDASNLIAESVFAARL